MAGMAHDFTAAFAREERLRRARDGAALAMMIVGLIIGAAGLLMSGALNFLSDESWWSAPGLVGSLLVGLWHGGVWSLVMLAGSAMMIAAVALRR
jgi:hypothetical protein